MRVYTQSNGAQRCVQWRVISGALQSRGWRPDWASDPLAATDGAVSGWRTVATSVVNTSTFPFTLDPAPSFGGRLIQLDIQVNKNSRLGATAEVQASVAGRNTEYYNTSQTTCSPVPTP